MEVAMIFLFILTIVIVSFVIDGIIKLSKKQNNGNIFLLAMWVTNLIFLMKLIF